jgi:hypothetical protein
MSEKQVALAPVEVPSKSGSSAQCVGWRTGRQGKWSVKRSRREGGRGGLRDRRAIGGVRVQDMGSGGPRPRGSVMWIAVGTALRLIGSGRPPHRSQRALLTHWALASDVDVNACCCLAYAGERTGHALSGTVSGACFALPPSPWPGSFPPPPPQPYLRPCSAASSVSGRRRRAHRAGLRPPLKLDVRISRIQLS